MSIDALKGCTIMAACAVFAPIRPKHEHNQVGRHSRAWIPRQRPQALLRFTRCRRRRATNDWAHARVMGQGCYPFGEPEILECEACVHHVPCDRDGRTL